MAQYVVGLFQKHHSFVEGCLNAKSGHLKRRRTYGDPINYFLRASAFYILNYVFENIKTKK